MNYSLLAISKSVRNFRLGDIDIVYRAINHRATKRLKISLDQAGSLTVSKPRFLSWARAEKFLEQKKDWILKRYKPQNLELIKRNKANYYRDKEVIRQIIKERLVHFCAFYELDYKRLAIRDQKTRWGSCSKDGNLNFNYRLIHLPERLRDYVIAHELCHRREFNHSPAFWELLAKYFPNYRQLRRELKQHNPQSMY